MHNIIVKRCQEKFTDITCIFPNTITTGGRLAVWTAESVCIAENGNDY